MGSVNTWHEHKSHFSVLEHDTVHLMSRMGPADTDDIFRERETQERERGNRSVCTHTVCSWFHFHDAKIIWFICLGSVNLVSYQINNSDKNNC